MGKMFNTLVLSGLISLTLLIFDGSGILGVMAQFFISPPSAWGNFLLDAMFSELGLATGVGLGAVVIGSLVVKQDWLYRMGFFMVLASWVNAPFIQLWTFLSSKTFPLETCTNSFTCATLVDGGFTTLGMILSALIVGPMILYALWACWSQIWSPESSG